MPLLKAESVLALLQLLPDAELARLEKVIGPFLAEHGLKVVPARLLQLLNSAIRSQTQFIMYLSDKELKSKRRPSAATVKRYAQMCDDRDRGKTLGELAIKYRLKKQRVQAILKDREQWRRWARIIDAGTWDTKPTPPVTDISILRFGHDV